MIKTNNVRWYKLTVSYFLQAISILLQLVGVPTTTLHLVFVPVWSYA